MRLPAVACRCRRTAAGLCAVIFAAFGAELEAQGTCAQNGFYGGTCATTDNATTSINITVLRAIAMSLSASGFALDAPQPNDFDAGFGQTTGPVLTVRANTPWLVSLRLTQPLWTSSAAPARADKPATDLQWARFAGGPFTDFTTVAIALTSGGATAGTIVPLFFRVKYAWTLDTPGTYSIPAQLTITAP